MDLNKLAEEIIPKCGVEHIGCKCEAQRKAIAAALARVRADERERCAQVATMFGEGCAEIAKKRHAAGEHRNGALAESGMRASQFIAEAIRALNNAQGEQG